MLRPLTNLDLLLDLSPRPETRDLPQPQPQPYPKPSPAPPQPYPNPVLLQLLLEESERYTYHGYTTMAILSVAITHYDDTHCGYTY